MGTATDLADKSGEIGFGPSTSMTRLKAEPTVLKMTIVPQFAWKQRIDSMHSTAVIPNTPGGEERDNRIESAATAVD